MLSIQNITYRIVGRTLLEGATLSVERGQKLGLVGRNGTGKTTLFRLITGEVHADDGAIQMQKGIRLGQVAQEAPGGSTSLIDTVLAADTERATLLDEAETATDPARIAEVHNRLADIDAEKAPARAARILAGLGFDETAQQRPCSDYSGGWRMRVALAAALFARPDFLLLDEPTEDLDMDGVDWLCDALAAHPGAVLVVSHNRLLLARFDHFFVLEESGCAGVCLNVCKLPTQQFLGEELGLPVTLAPDYETFECRFVYGKTPPPPEQDEAFDTPCFSQCPISRDAGNPTKPFLRNSGTRASGASGDADSAAADPALCDRLPAYQGEKDDHSREA